MGWFRHRREREDGKLLRAFLQNDAKRIEAAAQVDAKKQELELRKLELEMEHLEAIGKERRTDAREREELRVMRRENAAKARAILAQKRTAKAPGADVAQCRVCVDPSGVGLSAEEIWWHQTGHPAGGPQPIQWPQ